MQFYFNFEPLPVTPMPEYSVTHPKRALQNAWEVEFTAPLSTMLPILGAPHKEEETPLVASYLIGQKTWYFVFGDNKDKLVLMCRYSNLHEHDSNFEHQWYLKTYDITNYQSGYSGSDWRPGALSDVAQNLIHYLKHVVPQFKQTIKN